MRILFATLDKNPGFNSAPSSLFGKAESFLIYDTDSNDYFILDDIFVDENCSLHRDLKTLGVDNIVSNKICNPCYGNFIKAEIDLWKDTGSLTLKESYQKFINGSLLLLEESNCVCPRHKKREKIRKQEFKDLH